ncbi:MAG: metallophosphoesterase [Burkholderiales bacterium]|nr:metallophosphoesterase [Nitrosomonas sp.]MCP5273923.1 metallophosphoesterase [Burkholderiales bacterium]
MTNCPQTPQEDKPETLGFEKQKMVAWFRPGILFDSAVKAILADTFGKYADNRQIQAASKLDDPPYVDLSENNEIWFDYIADLGDGWDSTYTMARLLAEERLDVAEKDGKTRYLTQRGRFLIMGGDQVYPTASKDEYANRLIAPYRSALPWVSDRKNPLLFAIPGNHDWYDGLVSFSRLFHHKRWIGGWQTKQTRSYFAIKLPHDWWVWGIDIQLGAEVDIAQIEYFKDIARNRMRNGSKVILCSAEPSWVYAELKGSNAYDNMAYFEKRVIEDLDQNYRHDFIVGLSGDLHAYARYTDEAGTGRQRFIAGGGGAYLYPTHDLPDKLNIPQMTDSPPVITTENYHIGKTGIPSGSDHKGDSEREAVFPERTQSRAIADNCLLFPFKNIRFCLLAGGMYFLIAWILDSVSRSMGAGLIHDLKANGLTGNGQLLPLDAIFWATGWTAQVIANSPGVFLLLFAVLAGLIVFADSGRYGFRRRSLSASSRQSVNVVDKTQAAITRTVLGGLHFTLHSVSFVFTVLLAIHFHEWSSAIGYIGFIAAMIVIGGFFGGAIMGIYLWLSNSLIGAHSNEVFSSQSIPDYKNFLRLQIDKTGQLTIYPVGVEKVCKKWQLNKTAANGEAWFEPGEKNKDGQAKKIGEYAHLIETPVKVKSQHASSLMNWLLQK